MSVVIVGKHPLEQDATGKLPAGVATIFLEGPVWVAVPGIHAMQGLAYIEHVNAQRGARGEPPMTPGEEMEACLNSVDLFMDRGAILIRPDPEHMERAFAADEHLQELVSKRQIRFLHATNAAVQQAIKKRGELWRIAPLPLSTQGRTEMIRAAKSGIGQGPLYYQNRISGTRYLTFDTFSRLASMDPGALGRQLDEIREFSARRNAAGNPEIAFFAAESFGREDFAGRDFLHGAPEQVASWHAELAERFRDAVPPEFRADNPEDAAWRNRMLSALVGRPGEPVAEELLRGLSPEFHLQIRWLPGCRMENGEAIWDRIFDECPAGCHDPEHNPTCDWRARGVIFNLIREHNDVEYINVGRIENSLSERPKKQAHTVNACRGVYLTETKRRGEDQPMVHLLRMQKWGITQRLDDGLDMLGAIRQAEEYTEYVLDRRLGCRQLGMNLPPEIRAHRIDEEYRGSNRPYQGQQVWANYFERDYIAGIATDKIAVGQYGNNEYALALVRLLGEAAAPNLIVGRVDAVGQVLFDDGDEVVALDERGVPEKIIVADHTGAFFDYTSELDRFVAGYAEPVKSRLPHVPDPCAFAEAYIEAFLRRFQQIQREYRRKRAVFDGLFRHLKPDGHGNFADRWIKVLKRLERADAAALAQAVRKLIPCVQEGRQPAEADVR